MRQRRLMNQINVVPYIDVMLVLLVIFMVTAPMIQTGDIDLPSVGKANTQPPVAPLEVIVRADGGLALRDRSKGDQEQAIERSELAARLKSPPATSTVSSSSSSARPISTPSTLKGAFCGPLPSGSRSP